MQAEGESREAVAHFIRNRMAPFSPRTTSVATAMGIPAPCTSLPNASLPASGPVFRKSAPRSTCHLRGRPGACNCQQVLHAAVLCRKSLPPTRRGMIMKALPGTQKREKREAQRHLRTLGALLGPLAWVRCHPRGKSRPNRRRPDLLLDARSLERAPLGALFFARCPQKH